MSLTNKLILLVISIIFLTLMGSFYFQSTQVRQHLQKSQLEWVDTLTTSLSESVATDTINGNKLAVAELLQRIVKDDSIEFAYVTGMSGELFAHSYNKGFPRFLLERISMHSETIDAPHFDNNYKTKQGDITEFDAPLINGLSARIHVGINQGEVNTLVSNVQKDLFWFILLLALFAISAATIIGKRINLPLTLFTQKLLNYSQHKTKTFPKIKTSDPDVKNLIKAFSDVISEREKAEEELQKSQQRLLLHRELSPIGIIEWTTDFRFIDWNPAAEKIFGFSKEEVIGRHITENILPESAREQVDNIWKELIANTGGGHSINENITKDDNIITCEWHNTPLVNEEGKVVSVASFVEDITQQQKQEETLRRTQKMDALGKLTGGIAHDYNNMLGVVLGFTELLQMQLTEQPKLLEFVNEIQHAGERGAKLTQRLLGFSRQKAPEAIDVDLNRLLKSGQDMLAKTLTVRIKLAYDLADEVWPILVDIGDMEDMILNLSINAMHAMNEGGQLTFETRNQHLPLYDAQQLELDEGDYVLLTVTDTGSGMDKETESRIFEPFYSTKGSKGTGLGLSQVYGFVSRSGGAIKVYTEPGHGTRFAIYLPRSNEENSESENSLTAIKMDDAVPNGSETILVVDDETALADLTKKILETQGYSILLANGGKKALEIMSSNKVDLVITDIIMPEMDGYELANVILQRYPEMKLQLVSGFTDNRHQGKVPDELQQNLLYKPVNSKVLIKQVREILDS